MSAIQTIILKISNYTETQKIVRTFSREKGSISFITPTYVLKQKRVTLNILQITEVEYYENQRNELHKLKSVCQLNNLSSLYLDVYKMNIALLWAEVLEILLRKERKNEELHDFICYSIEYLNTATSDVANFNLFFLYRLTLYIGFKINTENYQSGTVFNISEGNFVFPSENGAGISGPNTAKAIYELCTCQLENVKDIALNRESRQVLLDIILLFFSIHLNVDLNIKSIKIIREVFL
ncbi:hypothetical protein FACS1894199_00090 [Bacteroidia bacterium]|nr:hypothetical protein FACS1894199_00090 [Bacteroidia bacterium]